MYDLDWTKDFKSIENGVYDFNPSAWAKASFYKEALRNRRQIFTKTIGGTFLETASFDDVCKKVKEVDAFGGEILTNRYDTSKEKIFVWNHTFLRIVIDATYLEITIYSFLEDFLQKLVEVLQPFSVKQSSSGLVYALVSSQRGPQFASIGVAALPLELENYSESVSKEIRHVIDDLSNATPCGRMIIFDGPAGTGKSFLVRGLLSEVKNAMFVVIPPDLVGELTNPGLIKTIISNHGTCGGPTIFIIEDADKVLASRGPDSLHLLSACLNLSDGILGSLLDIRIIATTNANYNDIDEAVLRPGRLCRRIAIGGLDSKGASVVYKRLTGLDKEFKEKTSLAEVYRLARQDGWEPPKVNNGVMGFRGNKYPPIDLDEF